MDTLTKPGHEKTTGVRNRFFEFLGRVFRTERQRRALIETRLNDAREASRSDPGLHGQLARLVHAARMATNRERSISGQAPLAKPRVRVDGDRVYTLLTWHPDPTTQGSVKNPFNGSPSEFSLQVRTSVYAGFGDNKDPRTEIGLAWKGGPEHCHLSLKQDGHGSSTIVGTRATRFESSTFQPDDTKQAEVVAQASALLNGPGEYTVS